MVYAIYNYRPTYSVVWGHHFVGDLISQVPALIVVDLSMAALVGLAGSCAASRNLCDQ